MGHRVRDGAAVRADWWGRSNTSVRGATSRPGHTDRPTIAGSTTDSDAVTTVALKPRTVNYAVGANGSGHTDTHTKR